MTGLYLVPTPIGNLEDMTFRSVRILKEVDLVLAEDTRVSGFLMKHFAIETPMRSFHQHNEHRLWPAILEDMKAGKVCALISDAGTPGISDPGYLLVRACIDEGIDVECLPGPTAFVPALVLSGLPADRFVFEGFLPVKKGRSKKLSELKDEKRTMIFYESPHRIVKTLKQLSEVMGTDRQASVSREISKKFEETKRGTLEELAHFYETGKTKGEFVLVVQGSGIK